MNRWRHRIGHSLGMRMVVLFLVLALALTLTFLGGMRTVFSGGWRDVLRPLVSDYVDRLAGDIGTPPDVGRAQALAQRLPLSIHIDGPVVNWESQPLRRHEGGWRKRDSRDADDAADAREQDGAWWLLTRSTADGHRIRFGLGDAGWQHRPRFIGWATLAMLLLMTALAYGYVRHLMRPLRDIRAGAVRFGQGDFSKPIAVRRRDELGDLAGQVNSMASSLHHMLDAKRQLLLAISHELRSPLTRARLNAELVVDSDENRDARSALLRDLAEMGVLITELLESERLSAGHAALQREDTDLNVLVGEVIAAHFSGRGVRVEPAAPLPRLSLDPVRIKLLLRNLLDNALRHSGDAALPPVVSTSIDGDTVTLVVRDHGPGVPPEQLPRLAEAFYRIDTARQRSTGGVGLGLYLCKLVAQAHGGQMTVRNAEPGLAIEVTFLAPSPSGRGLG
jgi:signal transduction histidine kinase